MKMFWISALIVAMPLAGCNVPDDEKDSQELNVNSRYTIENVRISAEKLKLRISDPLRSDLDTMVGQKLDRPKLERFAERIKAELRVSDVAIKVSRGNEPDHVIVNFEVSKSRKQDFDMNVSKLLYNSKEGWTGSGAASTLIKGNRFTFGILSDGDIAIERFAGIRTKFERPNIGTERLKLSFEFDSYHEQWNQATLVTAQPGDIYRTRQVFTPEATLVILPSLDWTFGVSFARMTVPVAGASSSKTESSNAVVNTLRYHQRWGSDRDEQEHEAKAAYSIASGTGFLDSDRIFTRQTASARYRFRHARHTVEVGFLAGKITGNAPLFERFVLGNSETLRGWNKYVLDPVGGSRVIHGSVDYRWRILQFFYDTGAIWDRGQNREQKQSIGAGFKKENFQLAVAFPLGAGHVDPIFYAGMNF
jgi:hypothetical protein